MAQLLFVHGRAQEFKDVNALKAQWIRAFLEGLARNGKQMPIPEKDIRFPYYGQALYDLVAGVPDDQVAKVQLRGIENKEELAFLASVIEEIGEKAGVTEEEIGAEVGPVAQ